MTAPWTVGFAVLGFLASPLLVAAIEAIPDKRPVRARLRSYLDDRGAWPRWWAAVGALNAALWGLAAARFGSWFLVVALLVLFTTLLVASVIDLRVQRIPDRLTFPATAAALLVIPVCSYVVAPSTGTAVDLVVRALVGMAAFFLPLMLVHLVSPAGMGFGDVKLAPIMGLYLGWTSTGNLDAVNRVFVALLIGCVVFIVAGVVMRLGLKKPFAFGPALAAGTVLIVLA
ncbi:MAG: prepilin peptidase [Acidimicrobiia bacterium]